MGHDLVLTHFVTIIAFVPLLSQHGTGDQEPDLVVVPSHNCVTIVDFVPFLKGSDLIVAPSHIHQLMEIGVQDIMY